MVKCGNHFRKLPCPLFIPVPSGFSLPVPDVRKSKEDRILKLATLPLLRSSENRFIIDLLMTDFLNLPPCNRGNVVAGPQSIRDKSINSYDS